MGQDGGNVMENLPILDGKNWHRWYAHIKVILRYQEVLEIVEKGHVDGNPLLRLAISG